MKEITMNQMDRVLKGFDITADLVIGTLGPKGRNVFIDDAMTPTITNDGAKISQNVSFPNKLENMGAYLVKNTSSQTNDDAGDGTTTTAALLKAIVHASLERPENPMEIKDSLQVATAKVLKKLKNTAKVIDKKDIGRVALISAENKKLADMVTDIMKKVGKDAAVTVEDSKTFDCSYEIIEGYEGAVGFMSTDFINDKKKARAVMTDVPVFVTEKKINTLSDISPLFEQFKASKISEAVIVCDDIDPSILGIISVNNKIGSFKSIVIRATGDMIKDIEAVVGATRISESTGVSFQTVDITKHLGHVKKIVSDANKTLFIPASSKGCVAYANYLQNAANEEPNMYIKERLIKRISQLRGGVAVLKIGAHTDFEREYLKLKAEDTVKAVKAALEEGIVEGGGMALWRISASMKPRTIGEHILKKSLSFPLRKIIENAGKDYAEVIKNMPEGMGYDAKRDKYVNMIEVGIIDPAKVERCALENSVSTASTFITVFGTISDAEPNKDNK